MSQKKQPRAVPDLPRSLDYRLIQVAFLSSLCTVLTNPAGWAAVLTPTALTTSNLSLTGSNNGRRTGGSQNQAFIDDRQLDTITFGATIFSRTNTTGATLATVQNARVVSGRTNVNAEFGDSDTISDGNSNPFVTAGIVPEGTDLTTGPGAITRESTDPAIQDPPIRTAFNGFSINEGVDGEAALYTLDLIFDRGIVDSSSALDSTPELIFFERGRNSNYRLQAITGGTFTNPTLGSAFNVTSAATYASKTFIDTIEIPGGQELGVAGIDLNDLAVGDNQPVYGVRVSAYDTTGPDLYGGYVSAASPSQFRAVPSQSVPAPPSTLGLLVLGFGVQA